MPRPYAYHEIRDVYDLLKSQGAVTETLPEWSAGQNAATGSHAFDSGVDEGNVIKPLMYHLRNLVGATGIPDVTAGVGELAGGLIGESQMGRDVGESAGYGVANLLPMLIPGLGQVATGVSLGGLAAANTYADTNSTGAAIASGFTAGLMPGVSNAVEQFALKRMGGEAVSGLISTNPAFLAGASEFIPGQTQTINRMFAKNLTQGAGAFLAGQGAAAGMGELGRIAESQLDPNADPYDFNLKRMALEMTVGQLPFAGMYLGKHGREQFGGSATREAVATLRDNMSKTEKAAGEYAARMEREAGNSLTTGLPDLNRPLDDEQLARVKAVLQPEQPVDLNLVGKLDAFKKAEAEGTTGNEELGRMKEELDTELAGNEHRLFGLSGVPTEKIEGIVHWGGSTNSNRSRTIELTAPALGHEAGTLLQFPVEAGTPLAKRGVTQVFDVPTVHSRVVKDAFPEKTAVWKANREKIAFNKSAFDEQNPLLVSQESEAGHQKWLEERAAERERQRAVLAEAEKRTADLWVQAKDVTRPGVDLADTLNKINEVHRELGMPDVSQEQVKEISKQLTYGKNKLVDLVEEAKVKIEVKKEVVDRVEQRNKERQDFRAQAVERLRLLEDMRLETDGEGKPTESALKAEDYMKQFNAKLKTHKDGAYRDFVAWHDGGYQGDFSPKAMRDNVTGLKDQSGLVKVAFEQGVPEKVSETPKPDEQVIKNEGEKIAERVKEMGRESQEDNGIEDAAFEEDWVAFTKETQKYPNPRDLIKNMDKQLLATPYVQDWIQAYAKEVSTIQAKPSFGPPQNHWDDADPGRLETMSTVDISQLKSLNKQDFDQIRGTARYRELLDRMKRFGFQGNQINPGPIVLRRRGDGTLAIEDGHHRIAAAVDAGIKEIPVEVKEQLLLSDRPKPSFGPPTPFVPTAPKDIKKVADIGATPLENLDYVIRNTKDPVTKALAVHFSQFKATLSRVLTEWTSNSSHATHDSRSREGRILLGEDLLSVPDHLTEFTIMHEVAHQLTLAELDNPTNIGISKGLDEMRLRLSEKLPTEVRARLKELQDTNWMERYASGETVPVIHKDPKWSHILYGLMNTKEFVSQGMSSKFMRGWMLEQKAQGGSWFNKFKQYVKQLLRFNWNPKDTAYDEFLHRTSELMDFSNHAAEFHTFADQMLKARGVLDDTWRNQQVRDAHGIVMRSVAESMTGRELLDQLNVFRIQDKVERQGAMSPELVKAAGQLQQTLKARGPEWQEIVDTGKELGFAPTLGGVHDFFDQSLMGTSNLEWKLDTLPTAMKKYLGEQVKSMDGILSVLDGAVRQGNKGLVNLTDPKVLEKPVRDAIRILQTFKDMQTNHEAGLNLAQTLSDVANPVNWIAAAGAPPKTKRQQVAHETIWGRAGKNIAGFMEQGAQLARRSPLFAEWFAKAGLLSNTISRKVDDTVSILHREIDANGRMGDLSAAQQTKIDRITKDPRMKEAARKWYGESNIQGEAAVTLLPMNDPSIAKEMGVLTPEERVLVKEYVDRLVMQKVHRDEQRFQTQREEAASMGSRLIIRSMGVKPDVATDAMHQVLDGVEAVLGGDQVGGQAKLAAIQAKLTPDAYVDTIEYAQMILGQLNADKDYHRANPAWVSAQRGGNFLFKVIVDGEPTLLSADDKNDARHIATKLTGKPDFFDWKENDRAHLPEQGPNDVERLADLTRRRDYQRNWLQEKGIDVSLLAEYDKLDVVRQTEREHAAAHNLQTAKPIMGRRGLKKGAQHLPWLMNQSKWIEKDTAYWERRLLAIQRDTMLMSPDYVNNPEVSAKVKQHSEALLSHDPELIRGIQKFVVTWGLTGNVASWMANGSQTVMRTFPELIRASGSPWQAAKEIASAWIDYGKHKTGRQDWNGPEENRFYAEAYRDGKISQSQFDEVGAKQVDAGEKYRKNIQGEIPRSKTEKAISAADAAGQWGMKLFKMGERANATVTLMATFRMLRKQGLEYSEAKRQAYEIHASSNDVGGRANRNIGMFDNKDKFSRGTAMLASTLQGYSIGSVTQLLRHINEGWGKGMTPAESYKAKKAAIAMATVQFTAAGMIGMPFVASLLSLLDKYVPELEANKKVRESVSWAFGDEGDQPGSLSQAFMMGLPSMLGWDMQSRLSSGNILPGVSEYNGFQPGALLGAPINTMTQFAKGASKLASGDTSGGLAFLPPALRKLGELWKEDGMIQDFKGRPVLNDLTGGEKVGIALGFQPKRLTDFNTAQRIAELGETNARRSKAQERQSWAQDVLKGNFGSVRAKMEQKANLDPNFDWKQEVRAIANEAEDLTFARDLRREGIQADSTQRSQLLRSFGLATGQADEKTRILFRQRIEQRFGLRGNKVRELRLAEEMDKIDRQSPGLSRVERRRIAEESLRPYWRQSAQPQIDE